MRTPKSYPSRRSAQATVTWLRYNKHLKGYVYRCEHCSTDYQSDFSGEFISVDAWHVGLGDPKGVASRTSCRDLPVTTV